MKLQAESKAEIRILKISRGKVEIEVLMPDGRRPVYRTLREGESYFNTVTLDVELPSGDLNTFRAQS